MEIIVGAIILGLWIYVGFSIGKVADKDLQARINIAFLVSVISLIIEFVAFLIGKFS
jgi:hypothetical protein